MRRIAVIGAGISGLTIAELLIRQGWQVTVYERLGVPGGLLRCKDCSGSLFHMCGGHVFNTKIERVASWFWRHFNREADFVYARRNATVYMPSVGFVGYPIENHVYQLGEGLLSAFVEEMEALKQCGSDGNGSFEDFLVKRFGRTLYDIYFRPYNQKIWRRPLSDVPISWLEGKLPMPSASEMLEANRQKQEETAFVHSAFWYPKAGGSQFIANRISANLPIVYNHSVCSIRVGDGDPVKVDGQPYERVVYCGNVRELPDVLEGVELGGLAEELLQLKSHGTTVAFCEIERNPYSWIYLPDEAVLSHRIICTGNLSPRNNGHRVMTGSVEFTDSISDADLARQLDKLPLCPCLIDVCRNECTYPIQKQGTRDLIQQLKGILRKNHIHLVGRFADWEYYNMDAAIDAALKLNESFI